MSSSLKKHPLGTDTTTVHPCIIISLVESNKVIKDELGIPKRFCAFAVNIVQKLLIYPQNNGSK